VLFKAIPNGTETTVKERARVGGRVTSEEYTTAKLFLKPGTVEFRKPDGSFEVSLKTVTDFQRSTREIAGSNRPALNFRHMKDGTAITTEAAMASPRKMAILGRFLRLEYSDLMQEIKDVELTSDKTEILVAMYSTGDLDGMPLPTSSAPRPPRSRCSSRTLRKTASSRTRPTARRSRPPARSSPAGTWRT